MDLNLFFREILLRNPCFKSVKDVHFVLQISSHEKNLYSNFLLSIVQISNAQWVNDPMINTHLPLRGQECVDPIAVADSSGNTLSVTACQTVADTVCTFKSRCRDMLNGKQR